MVKNRFANIVTAVDHAKTINLVHHIVRFQTLQQVVTGEKIILDFPVAGTEEKRLRHASGSTGGLQNRALASAVGTGHAVIIPIGRHCFNTGHQVVFGHDR